MMMQSGQVYRSFVRVATTLGLASLVSAIIATVLKLLVPQLEEYTSPLSEFIFYGIWSIGLIGSSIGLFHGIDLIRDRNTAWSEIKKRIQTVTPPEIAHVRGQSPHLLADSIDREVLFSIREIGGDILDVEEWLQKRGLVPAGEEYYRRIAKLAVLGLLSLNESDRRIYLTSVGMDAVNIPASLFVSRIPEDVWNYMFNAKTSLWQEEWGNIVVETSKGLEASMKQILKTLISDPKSNWESVRKKFSAKPIDEWGAGSLLGALRELGFVRKNSFEDHLAGELVKLRNRVHAKDNSSFGPDDADKCDIYLSLLMRSWYGRR